MIANSSPPMRPMQSEVRSSLLQIDARCFSGKVADAVAIGVVDRLEVVRIDQGAAQRGAVADGAGDLAIGLLVERAPAHHAGQRIGGGLDPQLELIDDQPGQVLEHGDLLGA